MIKLIELINEHLNQVFFKQVSPEPRYQHHYELQITNHLLRTVKVISFDTVRDLMDYVHEKQLMYDPTLKVAMVQIQSSGERHILQLNKVQYGDSQVASGFQDLNRVYQAV